ncbi:MAG: ABC transporter permease [Ilumatobacteraceae bacterium]|nr:ABC transporter permease [Ilumatobacteraceae bacterium]
MILLTLRDLVYRKTRFVVVSVLGAVVFALLFVMTGLVEQFNLEPVDTVTTIGADAWVVPEGVSGPFNATSVVPADTIDAVEADTKAAVVTSRSSLLADGEPQEVILVGHEPGGLGSPVPSAGRAARVSGELVADQTTGVEVGDNVTVAGRSFEVVGTTRNTTLLAGIPVVFITLPDAQELAFRTNQVVSAILVEGKVSAIPSGAKVMTSAEVVEDLLHPLDGAIASIDLVRGLLWIVAAIIIGAVVFLSALERQRDFAVLKAVGAPNSALLGSLALQAVLVALAAVALAAVIQIFLAPQFPLHVRVPARAFWQLPLLAVVMALCAGAVGMRKVLRSDPSQAFSGAGG